jgi:hypothetical protein
LVEREREVLNFVPKDSFRVIGYFSFTDDKGKPAILKSELNHRFKTLEEAKAFLEACNLADFKVAGIETKPATKSPAPPFTTSTLQQEASRKFGFSVSQTMTLAQHLYEAGHITYMRTDSVNLSDLALTTAKKEIIKEYGEEYSKWRTFLTKTKGAQEAHEAIRPTNMSTHSVSVDYDQDRLYSLIWKRTIASQMSDAELERTNVKISNANNSKVFTANGEMIKFDGFLTVYLEGTDNEDEEQEGEATCKFDSDCDPICEGDIKWKMGCNPRENTCVKTFDTDCSSEQDVFGNLSFSKTCKFGVCVSNEDAINEKKEELEEIKREMSNELKSLNATRDDLKNVMMDANKNCINGLADMTNVAILEFSTRIASLAAGGLPGLADVAVDYVSDAINKLSAYVNAPEESAEEVLKPHEYIKLNCDLYHHFIASLAATDKELEDILEKANQADAELKLLP